MVKKLRLSILYICGSTVYFITYKQWNVVSQDIVIYCVSGKGKMNINVACCLTENKSNEY